MSSTRSTRRARWRRCGRFFGSTGPPRISRWRPPTPARPPGSSRRSRGQRSRCSAAPMQPDSANVPRAAGSSSRPARVRCGAPAPAATERASLAIGLGAPRSGHNGDARRYPPAVSDAFSWHPEPELIGFRDPATAREALEMFGKSIWDASLDYLYDQASKRPVVADSYPEVRRRYFGETSEPPPAPSDPSTTKDLLREFRERIAPYVFNSQHPGAFSYFTAPPLPVSIGGEVLGQWLHQGVDVWAAGPIGALVEEEVTSWLRELVGYGAGSWGVLTSGGVMANVMAMTVARDVHLARLLGQNEPPRGRALQGVRVYASDQTHFSIRRALDVLGFPGETLHVIESDGAFRLHGAPVDQAIAEDRAAGL